MEIRTALLWGERWAPTTVLWMAKALGPLKGCQMVARSAQLLD
jgi:hypothetical protein